MTKETVIDACTQDIEPQIPETPYDISYSVQLQNMKSTSYFMC